MEIGNKELYNQFEREIGILDTRFKGYNLAIESINDLKKWLKENGLIISNDIYIKLRDKYPIVICGYCIYEGKRAYFYCDLVRSRNTYNSEGLYTANLVIHKK